MANFVEDADVLSDLLNQLDSQESIATVAAMNKMTHLGTLESYLAS